jgi:hypothetical protein
MALLGGGLGAALLQCDPLPSSSARITLGPAGGSLSFGPHRLVVPSGALAAPVAITAEIVSDRVNSVRFAPEGLEFSRSAALALSYANCAGLGLLLPKRVAYTDEALLILELLASIDLPRQQRVTGQLGHFSRYAVAY